jgi:hypothetical protein
MRVQLGFQFHLLLPMTCIDRKVIRIKAQKGKTVVKRFPVVKRFRGKGGA